MKNWVLGILVLVVVVGGGAAGVGYALGWFEGEPRSGSLGASGDEDAETDATDEADEADSEEALEDFCREVHTLTSGQVGDVQQWGDTIDDAGIPEGMTARAQDGRLLMIETFRNAADLNGAFDQMSGFEMENQAAINAFFAYDRQYCFEGKPAVRGPALEADPDY